METKTKLNSKPKKTIMQVRKAVERRRFAIQAIFSLLTNSYVVGFLTGTIYKGPLKQICVPGMNCYSCPGALGACPIGSLQAIFNQSDFSKGVWSDSNGYLVTKPLYYFAFYVVGFLMLVGALCGRLVCGFLCPFGLIQDLLHKIPFPKKLRTFRGDKLLRKLKYVILVVFVILLPMFLVDVMGQGAPYFCKLICPVGTLEGGIPLALMNKSMHSVLGWLYAWKNVLLVATILLSIIIYRPFCKYICPLGAIYSVFNPISVFKYRVDESKCVSCGACSKSCKMGVDPVQNANHPECIRCGLCKKVCPTGAISSGCLKRQSTADPATIEK